MSTLAKKIFAFASALAMVVTAVPAQAAVHAAGTNVNDNGTIRFVDNMGQTRAYTSAGAFLSYGFNSWSSVVPASAEDLALPRGSFVAPMPGSLINDNGTVYLMVDAGNGVVTRSGFTTPGNFLGLGYSWSNVMAGDTSFLTANSPINSTAMAHTAGTLVNQDGTVYLMTPSGKMGIPSLEVFNSWGFSFSKVVAANSYDRAVAMSSGIMPARVAGQLYPSQGTITPQPQPGSVSVGLASSNPAASTLVAGQAMADLAHFNFMGTGTITSITLNRTGVSADATLEDVFLFDGVSRLTDSATVSAGNITFTGLNIAVNGSKVLSVKADIAASTSGQTVGVSLASAMTGSSSVSGTPVSGNIHTIASATLATVAVGAPTPSSAATTDAANDVRVWESQVTVSERDVVMDRLALRNIGSIQSGDINNFRLLVDGMQVAAVQSLDANGYVTFSGFSKTLTTGTRNVKVIANVVGGSSRTIQMSLRNSGDLGVRDTQYNVYVEPTGTFAATTGAITVNAGTMTVVRASNSASGNVTNGANDQSLATYTFTAFGEPVKVESLTVNVDTSDTDADITLRNVRILVNGTQVGSTTSVPAVDAAASGTQFTTNFTVNPGTPATVEVRGDIYDSEGTNDINAADTILVTVLAGSSNAQKLQSLGALSVPGSNVAGNTVTVQTGSMTLVKDATYANQTVVVPQSAYKIGDWNLVGSSTEDINVHTLSLDIDETNGTTFNESDITSLYIKYGSSETTRIASATAADNNWSVSFTLAKNTTMPVEAWATLGSSVTAADAFKTDLTVTGNTVQSGTSVTASSGDVDGQTLTAGSGSLTATTDASTPVARVVYDNQTVSGAVHKFTSTNDAYTITDITETLADASNVSMVNLKVNGATVASRPGAATLSFSGLSIPVAANGSTLVTTELVLGTTGFGAGTSGASALVTLTAATAVAQSTGVSAAVTESNPAGNALYVYEATPKVERQSLPSSNLVAGTSTLAKFSVTSQGGDVAWKEVMFEITKSAAPTLASFELWDVDSNSQVTAAIAIQNDNDAGDADLDASDTSGEVLVTVGAKSDDNVEHVVNGTRNYELRATVGGTLASGNSVVVWVPQHSAYAASAVFTTNDNATTANSTSFTWSDTSAQAHDTGTADWAKDYKVEGLPTTTWTLTRS